MYVFTLKTMCICTPSVCVCMCVIFISANVEVCIGLEWIWSVHLSEIELQSKIKAFYGASGQMLFTQFLLLLLSLLQLLVILFFFFFDWVSVAIFTVCFYSFEHLCTRNHLIYKHKHMDSLGYCVF